MKPFSGWCRLFRRDKIHIWVWDMMFFHEKAALENQISPQPKVHPRKLTWIPQNDGLEKVVPYIWQFWVSGGIYAKFLGGKFQPQRSGGFISCISPLQHGPEKHHFGGSNSLRERFLHPFGPPKTQLMKLPLQQNSWGSWSVMKNIPLKTFMSGAGKLLH